MTDARGDVYTITSDGTFWRWSADLGFISRVPTGQEFYRIGTSEARIDIDARGNICVMPSCEHFMVYAPDGRLLVDLESSEPFFRDADYFHSFALSRDRTKAYVVGGHQLLFEVILPDPPSPDGAIKPSPAPCIRQGKDYVDINGVRVRNHLYALDTDRDGEVLAQVPFGGFAGILSAPAMGLQGQVCFGNKDGYLHAVQGRPPERDLAKVAAEISQVSTGPAPTLEIGDGFIIVAGVRVPVRD